MRSPRGDLFRDHARETRAASFERAHIYCAITPILGRRMSAQNADPARKMDGTVRTSSQFLRGVYSYEYTYWPTPFKPRISVN